MLFYQFGVWQSELGCLGVLVWALNSTITALSNSESESTSSHTMWRKFKVLELNSSIVLKKTLTLRLINKKAPIFLGSIKIGRKQVMWSWWVQIFPVPEWWVHQVEKSSSCSAAPIIPSVYCTTCGSSVMTWGSFTLSGLSSVTLCLQKNEVSWQPDYTDRVFYQ